MYHGGFERNARNLKAGVSTFESTDGTVHNIPEWPANADGLHIGYMEKSGKKFCVVRVSDRVADVILPNEMVIEPGRHLGFGKRFGAEPTLVDDDTLIVAMLEDIIKKNADSAVSGELLEMRRRLKESKTA
jgi:hypothetical protein